MSACDDVRTARVLEAELAAEEHAHAATCAACAADTPAVALVARRLAAHEVPAPDGGLRARVIDAASPLLASHARRAERGRLVRAVAVGLVPLPLVVLLDVLLVRYLDALLTAFLPRAVALWLVADYAAMLALLLGVTYAAIPVVATAPLRRLHAR